jgi:hypothetical protein
MRQLGFILSLLLAGQGSTAPETTFSDFQVEAIQALLQRNMASGKAHPVTNAC